MPGAERARLEADVRAGYSDATWLRQAQKERESLNEVARMQSDLWMGGMAS